jgi:hypothetical protein
MGRKLVDATNAWRMRRTRGDTGFLRLFTPAERVWARKFLLVTLALLDALLLGAAAVLLAGWEDFALADGT